MTESDFERSLDPGSGSPERYLGLTAVGPDHDKIGSVNQVYVNDDTGEPDWVTVHTGFFGTTENFVPLRGSRIDGDSLVLPFGKDLVKAAPQVADASHLDADEQDQLHRHYSTRPDSDSGIDTTADEPVESRSVTTTSDSDATVGHDTSGPTTDSAMTRSEEHLNVGTQRVEAGRARLRKYVVTEQQTVTVPVSHEEVRVVREPITEANRGDALDGPAISEEEHEVVLHAERPVVETEAVPVERIRLDTETVTDEQQVTGEVRKEQVEVVDGTSTTDPAHDPSR